MDELQKTALRNYVTAAGFFIIAVQFLVRIIGSFFKLDYREVISTAMMGIVPAIIVGLLAVGIILVILKKRNLTAIIFLMIAMYYGFINLSQGSRTTGSIIIGMFLMILAVIILSSKDSNKFLICLIPGLLGFSLFFAPVIGTDNIIVVAIRVIITLLCIYFAFACVSERFALPFKKLLTKDSEMDFKSAGSVLGYVVFGVACSALSVSSIANGVLLSSEICVYIGQICGSTMAIIGVLLIAVEKVKFTPLLFILAGLTVYCGVYTTGILLAATGILFIFLGLFALLQKDVRILPAFMMIITGVACFVSITIGVFVFSEFLTVALYLVPTVIAIYLSFGLITETKLPLV
ncbi:MAG: hypothetical protein Q4Q53_00510 [Methanocorpusculum sp.]|nr:hypothetical protein [Methanocorpusculum sp.]